MTDFLISAAVIAFLVAMSLLFIYFPMIAVISVSALAIGALLYGTYEFFNWLFSESVTYEAPNNPVIEHEEAEEEIQPDVSIKQNPQHKPKEPGKASVKESAVYEDFQGTEEIAFAKGIVDQLYLEDPVSLDPCSKLVIASDLYAYQYDDKGYLKLLAEARTEARAKNQEAKLLSPITREELEGNPFPFSYVKLQNLYKETKYNQEAPQQVPMKEILDLAICPVTKTIMKHPRVAHLIYTDASDMNHHFVLVCDKSALATLPSRFTLKKAIEFTQLERVIQQGFPEGEALPTWPKLAEVFEKHSEDSSESCSNEATASSTSTGPKSPNKADWEAAYKQSKVDFPSVHNTPAPSMARNVYSLYNQGASGRANGNAASSAQNGASYNSFYH